MRALDLYCCAGGSTRGLQLAGFHVTGVDINPQPRYCGDAFIQGDALEADLSGFDFIWASPPCQAFSSLRHLHRKERPNLIPATRRRLIESGTPYCIENVEGAPLGESGSLTMLCGTMFGLQTKDGRGAPQQRQLDALKDQPVRTQAEFDKLLASVVADRAMPTPAEPKPAEPSASAEPEAAKEIAMPKTCAGGCGTEIKTDSPWKLKE